MKAIASPPALTTFPSSYKPAARPKERVQVVRDMSQLIEKILTLQPHDQVEMVLSTENLEVAGQLDRTAEERGFLMDIRLGPEANFCIKRTF